MTDDTDKGRPETIRLVEDGGRLVPVVTATGQEVARFVHAAHEAAIDDAVEAAAAHGLDRDAVDAILVYCAERGCEREDVTCAGCQRRSDADGFATIDDFIAAHAEIDVGREDVSIAGRGERRAAFNGVGDLQARWAGEEYWFWARRVLRKLRHGVRRADVRGAPIAGEGETPAILLMEPQLADNIGMVARAMGNFGLDDLRLIAPRDGWPNEKARVAASGANYIVDDAKPFETLEESIGDLNWVCATTARQRDLRKPVLTPEQAVEQMSSRIAAGQRCGVLFGRERNGLETGEVANADALVMIPVNSKFASINLAQSVLIVGYAWMRASDHQSLGRVTTYEKPVDTGLYLGSDTPAEKEQLIGFYEHLEDELERRGFFYPEHRRAKVVRSLRSLFARAELTAQEVRTLRGIVATLSHGKGAGRKA